MKVVLDTNVLLSALAARGLCDAVLQGCLAAHELVLSDMILQEVLKHLPSKFKLPPAHAEEIVAFLRSQATIVTPVPVSPDACRDSSDLEVLGTAVAGQAECLVSGDEDLLVLKRYRGIEILSPRAFHDWLC